MSTCEICGRDLAEHDEKDASLSEKIEGLEAISQRLQELLDNPVKTRNVLKLLIQACDSNKRELMG